MAITITVSSVAALKSALATALAGETIQLAPGTYSGVSMTKLNFSSPVKITSADPSNQAVLTDLTVVSSHNLSFSQLEFSVDGETTSMPFAVRTSTNISFDHLNVHGSMDGNPQDDTSAFQIQHSTNVKITNSEFQQLNFAIYHFYDTNLTISGNSFHDIRTDGIHGGGSSYVNI